MLRFGGTLLIALTLSLWPALASANGVAKFRVVESTLKGTEATVNLAWEFQAHPGVADGGKGVQFHVHVGEPPGYGNADKGTPVGTVDMNAASGMAAFKFDTAKLNVQPGAKLTLTGRWPNSHQWGTDKDRPGGEFTLPAAQNSRLRRLGIAAPGRRLLLRPFAPWSARRLPSIRSGARVAAPGYRGLLRLPRR